MATSLTIDMTPLRRMCAKTALDIARETERQAKQSMHRGKSRTGQAPGIRTGTLQRSIKARQFQSGDAVATLVEASAPYSLELETVQARPFLVPALKNAMRKMGFSS